MFQVLEYSLEAIRQLRLPVQRLRSRDRRLFEQIRAAASSVALNLAEGSRRSGGDRLHHFRVAAGSADELRTALRVAVAWGAVSAAAAVADSAAVSVSVSNSVSVTVALPMPFPSLLPAAAAGVLLAALAAPSLASGAEPFAYRGYYFILSRNPGYGLSDYRLILDRMAEDGVNTLILWIGGGFRSRRYPETWDYNREHRNVKEDFAGAAIEHAHARGIKVVLGLTPFAYDGVNRYGAAHPEIGAADRAGNPIVTGGIHSLGRGLCPSQPAAREFMLGYARELGDDFYPHADGFFLEHSDYGTCACPECADGKGLRREWEFVAALSAHVWAKKPDALMLVYPQYADLGVAYDPRHVIFLAPHNMKGAERLRNPKVLWSGYWDAGAFWKGLCREAARAEYAGVIPSMENFLHENPHAFDARWGPEGAAGWDDLLVRITRLSFREFSRQPDLADAGFRRAVRAAFLGDGPPEAAIDDLLSLHEVLNRWSGWTHRAGVMKVPAGRIDPTALERKVRDELETRTLPDLRSLQAIRGRSLELAAKHPAAPGGKTLAEMARIAGWVLARWEGKLPEGLLESR